MQLIPLSAVPNQALSIRLDDHLYDIVLKFTGDAVEVTDGVTTITPNGITAVDISRDGSTVVLGMRAVADFPLLPYQYLESGNFIISTMNGDLPNYTQFGVTQFLIYASQLELEVLRAGT